MLRNLRKRLNNNASSSNATQPGLSEQSENHPPKGAGAGSPPRLSPSSSTSPTSSTSTTTASSKKATAKQPSSPPSPAASSSSSSAWHQALRARNNGLDRRPSSSNPNSHLPRPSYTPNRTIASSREQQQDPERQDTLAKFDSCIEAADALAARSSSSCSVPSSSKAAASGQAEQDGDSQQQQQQHDATTTAAEIADCSVLVSPDGDLLLVPNTRHSHKSTLFRRYDSKASNDNHDDVNASNGENNSSNSNTTSLSELGRTSLEYESAVFVGNDLDPSGDAAWNRFSAKGWSLAATSVALTQTRSSLQDWTHFLEQVLLHKKQSAAETSSICDGLRQCQPALGGRAPPATFTTADQDWECILSSGSSNHGIGGDLQVNSDARVQQERVGPLLAPTSTVNQAVVALEEYYADTAQKQANRWRVASSSTQHGLLPKIHHARSQIAHRIQNRQVALEMSSLKARQAQDRLDHLKQVAEQQWEAVYQAEDQVTLQLQEVMQERSREREKQRLAQLRLLEQQQSHDAKQGTLGATSEEIWDIVSSVAETMESGSFEPVDLPSAPLSLPKDQSRSLADDDQQLQPPEQVPEPDAISVDSTMSSGSGSAAPPQLPTVTREQIEYEVGLPALRALAMAADDAVADAADSFMSLLSSLDTTRRSARIAAETCLVSAGQAQAASIRALVEQERACLLEQMARLDTVQEVVDKIDFRADLDVYINADKRLRGGLSPLGDDDDGGLASALAVLSRHVDGSSGQDSMARMNHNMSSGNSLSLADASETATPELIDELVEKVFEVNKYFLPETADCEEKSKALQNFQESVTLLCKTVSETGTSARARRSAVCYSLNSKRGTHAELTSQIQFDGLCRIFDAILTGCNKESGSYMAKMCMMLAQTFYIVDRSASSTTTAVSGGSAAVESSNADTISEHSFSSLDSVERSQRIFVKSHLIGHALWSNEDFWDQAFTQQITESLTHSGVMANFEKSRESTRKTSEWTQSRKTKWYDLNYKERTEAAAQVHAVVFAQLGALAHSMMEFGCGLERSVAFVRRMSVQNQLPSSQRTMLLLHLIDRHDAGKRELQKEAIAGLTGAPIPRNVEAA